MSANVKKKKRACYATDRCQIVPLPKNPRKCKRKSREFSYYAMQLHNGWDEEIAAREEKKKRV